MKLHSILTSGALLLCGSALVAAAPQDAEVDASKPNIIVILVDDQDQQMGSLDYMPKVQDLLINEGTHYKRHYCPTALCCPARVSIWTGLHAHNHRVLDVNGVSTESVLHPSVKTDEITKR